MGKRVAVIQMNSSDDVAANLARVRELLARAAGNDARVAILPEMFSCIGGQQAMQRALQWPGHAAVLESLQALAAEHGIWLVAGTIPWCEAKPSAGQKAAARCWVLGDDGSVAAHYDKMHLFDAAVADRTGAYRESDSYVAGKDTVLVDTPLGRLGLAVCYDLRFPELFRRLWQRGAELFALPSAFTAVTGEAHWAPLLRARAIENCSYMLAPNQAGLHADGRRTWGHSAVVDPWGAAQFSEAGGEDIIYCDIDLQRMRDLRERMPCHAHQAIPV